MNNTATKIAQVTFNGDLFIFSPLYNTHVINSMDFSNVRQSAISDMDLGVQLKISLDSSLLDWSHEISRGKTENRYKEWREKIIAKYNYKNKHAFFVNMNLCTVFEESGSLLFSPDRHESLEGWGTESGDEQYEITIPAVSSPELIGKTLRIALERASEM